MASGESQRRKSFFDQVNHDKLMNLVARKVRDKGLLRLIGAYLRAPLRQPDGSSKSEPVAPRKAVRYRRC